MHAFWLGIVLAAVAAPAFAETTRSISNVLPGTARVVVVAEGQLEPRSAGSYSVRIYGGTNPRFPRDDFIAGVVRPRDGGVDQVLFSDLDRDGSPEIVVVVRSAGTGGFLSADAYRLRGASLTLVGSVSGLAKDADPLRALEAADLAYRGRFYWDHEVRSFKPCGSKQSYWVKGEGKTLQSLRDRVERLRERRGKPYQPVYVEATGAIDTGTAREGFAKDYDGLFELRSVERASDIVPKDCAA